MSNRSGAASPSVVDLIDDGMTDEQIAAHTQAWLDEVRMSPGIELPETATEALDAEHRDAGMTSTSAEPRNYTCVISTQPQEPSGEPDRLAAFFAAHAEPRTPVSPFTPQRVAEIVRCARDATE